MQNQKLLLGFLRKIIGTFLENLEVLINLLAKLASK